MHFVYYGVRVATGMGPCNGQPSSLQCEAAAILAISLFISMVQEFTNFAFLCLVVTFAADNKSLLKRQKVINSIITLFAILI